MSVASQVPADVETQKQQSLAGEGLDWLSKEWLRGAILYRLLDIVRETGGKASEGNRRFTLANSDVYIGSDFILEARNNQVLALAEWRVGSTKRGIVETGDVWVCLSIIGLPINYQMQGR